MFPFSFKSLIKLKNTYKQKLRKKPSTNYKNFKINKKL